jgi:hypothetical protein
MENPPYLLVPSCPGPNCEGNGYTKHCHVNVSRVEGESDDKSCIIYQNDESRWEIKRIWSKSVPTFTTADDSALFACMDERFYFARCRARAPEAPGLEISLYANFGVWPNIWPHCAVGQWVVFLQTENGIPRAFGCGDSYSEAKKTGLRLASVDDPREAELSINMGLGLTWILKPVASGKTNMV